MPANIMLPTKAKMTAFVCSGRRRPKVAHDVLKFACQNASCVAISTPTAMPTMPQTMVAHRNFRTTPSLNSIVVFVPELSAAAVMNPSFHVRRRAGPIHR
jgi:hypothetical protein